ncbi:MAG: DUF4304 domain-containing protein [Acidimicrobiales bacterium]
MSVSSELIDAVIKGQLAPVLKQAGFKRSGRNWHQSHERSVVVVNVQASAFNTPEQTRFTINLGVWFPELAEFQPANLQPSNRLRPTEPHCHFRQRVGGLLPGGLDRWWELGSVADVELVGVSASEALTTYGLPWLRDRSEPVDALNVRLSECGVMVSLIVDCGLALIADRPDIASSMFHKWLIDSDTYGDSEQVTSGISWAKQHNLG